MEWCRVSVLLGRVLRYVERKKQQARRCASGKHDWTDVSDHAEECINCGEYRREY
jgi:hypothetical protein